MKKKSAGILLYRYNNDLLEVLLAHPGGPFYKNRDLGVWSIPKGEYTDNEIPKDAAIREFQEEIGFIPEGKMIALTPLIQKSGKEVSAWAIEGDFDPQNLVSNTFPLEWPPKSGIIEQIVEVDRVEWFAIDKAHKKIIPGQGPILDELVLKLSTDLKL